MYLFDGTIFKKIYFRKLESPCVCRPSVLHDLKASKRSRCWKKNVSERVSIDVLRTSCWDQIAVIGTVFKWHCALFFSQTFNALLCNNYFFKRTNYGWNQHVYCSKTNKNNTFAQINVYFGLLWRFWENIKREGRGGNPFACSSVMIVDAVLVSSVKAWKHAYSRCFIEIQNP